MQIHAKKESQKCSKQRHKVYQIRPVAWSHLAQHNSTHVNQTEYHVTNSWPTAWALQAGPLFSEVSRSCPWSPKHLIWMYHVAAVLYSQSDPCLTLTPVLLTFTQRLPNICLLSGNRLIQLGRPHRTSLQVAGGWVRADSCPGDWRTERWSRLADHRYLGISARLSGTAGQPHLANGWYSTNAAHLKLPGWGK